ncbi:hypothetical protein RCH20_000877 [Psychrobacter sp. PL15]|uniref:GIY-YIG nuclease family protein n=1 Tax=Psychrobacter sp. PL15 TaxID=3071719 RepID=UPI002E035903|nr:hypothetical protein [Psychrobacter sp. PL15]
MIKLDDIYESREYKSLSDIFDNDDLGIFDNVKSNTNNKTSNSVLEQQFSDINSFIDNHGRLPAKDADTLSEKVLSRQLNSMKSDSSASEQLNHLDRHGLLVDKNTDDVAHLEAFRAIKEHEATNSTTQHVDSQETASTEQSTTYNSLQDIFNSDDLGIFDNVKTDIVVSDNHYKERSKQGQYDDEDIASRFECKDFYRFEPTFARIHKAIESGDFTKTNFSSTKNITVGSVFVLNGFVCYVADIYKAEARKNTRSQERLRLIFANGTESNMLTYSLATAQYKYENSYQLQITDPEWVNDDLAKNFGDDRQPTGVIYIAQLIETPDNLEHYKNLYKVGFSKLTGDVRTKHSIRDTAFLQQPVNIIAEWQVYDADPRKVESVLHAFFYEQRVKMSSKGSDDRFYKATEWFDIPLSEIDKAINIVISGDIEKYRMDPSNSRIIIK